MNKKTKILFPILAILIIILAIAAAGTFTSSSSSKNVGLCADAPEQRLGTLVAQRAELISSTTSLFNSTSLTSGNISPKLERVDSKASGDCVGGTPAGVYIKRQETLVNQTVRAATNDVANSLTSQGFTVEAWQVGLGCGTMGANTSVAKDGVTAKVRIERQDIDCSELSQYDEEALWDLNATNVFISTTITSLGIKD